MTPTVLGILAMALTAGAIVIYLWTRKRAARKQRDFTRTLETVLLPRETVKAICPRQGGRWILTNKRLLMEQKGGFHALPLEKIKSAQGKNAAGNRTGSPANMVSLTVKADKDYTLKAGKPEFAAFAAELLAQLKKQREKKKKS